MQSDPDMVEVPSGASVRELSRALGTPMQSVMKALLGIGVMKTATQALTDFEMRAVARTDALGPGRASSSALPRSRTMVLVLELWTHLREGETDT